MAEWKAKRFWKAAAVAEAEGGWEVRLDGRPVRTPLKAPLILPTRAMAEAVAAEWDAQEGEIRPLTMPVTRAANSAIDKVARQFAEVAGLIAAYGDSDLICYRAVGPAGLVARQAEAWDPLVAWARDSLGAPLTPVAGVMHHPQPAESLARLKAHVDACTPFGLTALSDLVALSGSLVIGLAATGGLEPPEALWQRSRVDEQWQTDEWGDDSEAREASERKRAEFISAERFFRLSATA